jgi:hypothetical protein
LVKTPLGTLHAEQRESIWVLSIVHTLIYLVPPMEMRRSGSEAARSLDWESSLTLKAVVNVHVITIGRVNVYVTTHVTDGANRPPTTI